MNQLKYKLNNHLNNLHMLQHFMNFMMLILLHSLIITNNIHLNMLYKYNLYNIIIYAELQVLQFGIVY